MRYQLIIQQMKESHDYNVKAFVRDVERKRRLTTEERQYYLTNIKEPYAVSSLVEDMIPYVIKVAYEKSESAKNLSILDLVNEGIVGAYAAIAKYHQRGIEMPRPIRTYIIRYIDNVIKSKDSIMSEGIDLDEYASDVDFFKEIDRIKQRRLLTKLIMDNYGSRDGNIIIDYYLDGNTDLKIIAKKYNVSRERIRQIACNFSKLYKVDHLWSILSKDFNLPTNQKSYYNQKHNVY